MDAYSYDPRRDRRGNMEGIPGFNLTYNDPPTHAPPASDVTLSMPPPKAVPQPPPYFQNVASRVAKRQSGSLNHDAVLRNARERPDRRALRASDGAPLRVPYKVVLKSSKSSM